MNAFALRVNVDMPDDAGGLKSRIYDTTVNDWVGLVVESEGTRIRGLVVEEAKTGSSSLPEPRRWLSVQDTTLPLVVGQANA